VLGSQNVVVDRLQRSEAGGLCTISARVRRPGLDAQRLWFSLPAEFAPEWPDGSPFLAGVLLWAMRHAADVVVDGPVSPMLLANLDKIVAILQSLSPADRRRVVIEASPGPPPPSIPTTGAFFTRGVDSWYAVLEASHDDAQLDPPLTHLVFCPDFLSELNAPALVRAKTRATAEAAAATGLRFVEVRTNIKRDFGGAQLMSTALALGLQRMLVPSGAMHGEIVRATTHPVLDYRFSTERTQIVHYGDANRLDKVARVAGSKVALDTLRVCHHDGELDENCGRCEKCLRTMLQLHVAGALDRASTLPGVLDPLCVADVRRKLGRRHQWVEILHALPDDRRNRELAAAVRIVLAHDDLLSASASIRDLGEDGSLRRLHRRLPRTVRHASALARSACRLVAPSAPGRWRALGIRTTEGIRESAAAYWLRHRWRSRSAPGSSSEPAKRSEKSGPAETPRTCAETRTDLGTRAVDEAIRGNGRKVEAQTWPNSPS
jgi:hypothetical protein